MTLSTVPTMEHTVPQDTCLLPRASITARARKRAVCLSLRILCAPGGRNGGKQFGRVQTAVSMRHRVTDPPAG